MTIAIIVLVAFGAVAGFLVVRDGGGEGEVASEPASTPSPRTGDGRAPPSTGEDPATGPPGETATAVLTPIGPATDAALAEAARIVAERLEGSGGGKLRSEAEVQGTAIIVRYAGRDADRAIALASAPGSLRIRPVLNQSAPGGLRPSAEEEDKPEAKVVLPELDDGAQVALYELGPSLADGTIVETAEAEPQRGGGDWKVTFRMTSAGGRLFDRIASTCHPQPDPSGCPTGRLAIVFGGRVLAAPSINTADFGGTGEITGRFNEQEATDLALILRTGALPVNLRISSRHSSP